MMKTHKIEVIFKSVYGRETIYPANEQARAFCMIAGTSTITPTMVTQIRKLGFEITEVHAARSILGVAA